MTIEEARKIIKKTDSPYLKRDMRKFIQRQKKKAMDNPVLKLFFEQTS